MHFMMIRSYCKLKTKCLGEHEALFLYCYVTPIILTLHTFHIRHCKIQASQYMQVDRHESTETELIIEVQSTKYEVQCEHEILVTALRKLYVRN